MPGDRSSAEYRPELGDVTAAPVISVAARTSAKSHASSAAAAARTHAFRAGGGPRGITAAAAFGARSLCFRAAGSEKESRSTRRQIA